MDSGRFDTAVYARRLAAAAAATEQAGLAGLVITPGYDLRYLIGSRADTFERLTALVLPASGVPTIVLPRLELASLKESAASDLGVCVRDWVDGDDPYQLVAVALGGAPAATAVTDSMPALHLLPLADALGVLPVLATDVLRQLRMVKEAAEVDALAKAGAAIDRVHARVPAFLVPGRTEAQVAADIAEAIVAEGHSAVAFVIVGSGPHGADPHHGYSDRKLQVGDIVVVDIGGHTSPDTTRTRPEPTASAILVLMWHNSIRPCSGLSVRPLMRSVRGLRRHRSTLPPVTCWPTPDWPSTLCTAPDTVSGCVCMRSPISSPATSCRWSRAWRSRSSRASTFRAGGEPASRTLWWLPKTVRYRSTIGRTS
ncbi:metallopeptidase M24 family protein [Mycobacterium ulcerans str. Harvey]|uniref:Metallopeptidase M24 family protein n=1 Tax=Mycobacterium ulcerans str. Harvey TaxID=1299332 RepID=A0ABN0QYT3_MYCUL|nr:metallopeptidase M24 family protein [Mycobacterium ulcerans str. Harvey]